MDNTERSETLSLVTENHKELTVEKSKTFNVLWYLLKLTFIHFTNVVCISHRQVKT